MLLSVFGLASNDGGKNKNAFLAFPHEPPELMPSVKPSHVRRRWLLQFDQHDVTQTVPVETANRRKISCQHFAVAPVERRDELLGGPDYDLFDLFLFDAPRMNPRIPFAFAHC